MSSKAFVRPRKTDHGDHDVTPFRIFNICFVPDLDDKRAAKYHNQVIKLSRYVAKKTGESSYILDRFPVLNSMVSSKMHATVTHVVVRKTHMKWKEAAFGLNTLIGRKQNLLVTGLQHYNGKPFDRLAKATDGKHRRLKKSVNDRVLWMPINLKMDFREMQETVRERLASCRHHGLIAVSAAGDTSMPHHTIYVERYKGSTAKLKPLAIPAELVPEACEIPHILAIADCGPWGQVRRYEMRPGKIEEFLRLTP